MLKHSGELIELFGVVKWHNVMKFVAELLALKGPAAVTTFANHVLGESRTGEVPGKMGVPGAVALQPLLVACTLVHINLDVSGSTSAGAGDSGGAKVSTVLADGLKQNTMCTSMRLNGIHASDVASLLSSSTVLIDLDISGNKLDVAGVKCIAEAIQKW